MNVQQLFTALDVCATIGRTAHIIGAHGTGKSSLVYQWAAKHNRPVVEKRLGLMADAGDLIGLLDKIKTKDGVDAVRHLLLDWFTTMKPNSVLFLDEVNRAHKDILQAIFELIYDKKLNGVSLPEGCVIIAASNPANGDYMVMDFSDPAFQDRMVHLIYEPTKEDFYSYADSKNWNKSVIAFYKENPQHMRQRDMAEINLDFVKPSHRSIEAHCALEDIKGLDTDLKYEILTGMIGNAAVIALMAWEKSQDKVPDIEEVLNNYEKHRPLLEKMVKNEKLDQLGVLKDNMLDFSRRPGQQLNEVHASSLEKLAILLPNELSYGLMLTLVKEEYLRTHSDSDLGKKYLFYNKDLCNKFKNLKDIREKYLNQQTA